MWVFIIDVFMILANFFRSNQSRRIKKHRSKKKRCEIRYHNASLAGSSGLLLDIQTFSHSSLQLAVSIQP